MTEIVIPHKKLASLGPNVAFLLFIKVILFLIISRKTGFVGLENNAKILYYKNVAITTYHISATYYTK